MGGRSGKGSGSESATADSRSFEDVLRRLEEIVEGLEKGERPLEESLRLFEEGVSLAREGHRRIESAERRISALLEDGSEQPLEEGDGGGASGAPGE